MKIVKKNFYDNCEKIITNTVFWYKTVQKQNTLLVMLSLQQRNEKVYYKYCVRCIIVSPCQIFKMTGVKSVHCTAIICMVMVLQQQKIDSNQIVCTGIKRFKKRTISKKWCLSYSEMNSRILQILCKVYHFFTISNFQNVWGKKFTAQLLFGILSVNCEQINWRQLVLIK